MKSRHGQIKERNQLKVNYAPHFVTVHLQHFLEIPKPIFTSRIPSIMAAMEEEVLHVEEPSKAVDSKMPDQKEDLESVARDALKATAQLQTPPQSPSSQMINTPLGFPFHRKTGKVRLPRERDGFSSSEEELSDDYFNMPDRWQVCHLIFSMPWPPFLNPTR